MKLDEIDKELWESKGKYVLLKKGESISGKPEYNIFTRNKGQLMMTIIEEDDYAQLLCKKMLEEGVMVFENILEVQAWARGSK